MPDRELVRCRWCNRLIFWAETIAGKAMPLDPSPKPFEPPPPREPNVVIDEGTGKARVLGHAELAIALHEPSTKRYLPHWASCLYSRQVHEYRDRRRRRLEREDEQLEELRHGGGR